MSDPLQSATIILTALPPLGPTTTGASVDAAPPPPSHLRLRLRARKRRVRWAEDVEDNEELCRKKSKCCCIFHKPMGLDESSDEEEPLKPSDPTGPPGQGDPGGGDESGEPS